MPISPAFTVSQSAISPNEVLITDSSTGSDGSISQRRVFIQTSLGTYLVPSGTSTSYVQWSYSDSTILLNVLPTDYAVAITVQWLNSSNTVLYTLTQEYALVQNNKQFLYYLIQQQALTYTIIADTNYLSNLAAYWMNIVGAVQAIEIGADIAASQACIDRATNMMQNQQLYFSY